MGLPLLFLPIHIVWLELVIHRPPCWLSRICHCWGRSRRYGAVDGHASSRPKPGWPLSWSRARGIAVVWSYLHALARPRRRACARDGADRAAGCQCGFHDRPDEVAPGHRALLVVGTLVSLGVLIQVPAVSDVESPAAARRRLGAGRVAFAMIGMATLGLASRLRRHLD